MAVILQSQIYEDCGSSHDEQQQSFPEFEILPVLPPEYGGNTDSISKEVIDRETLNNPGLRFRLISGMVPSVDSILRSVHDA